MRDLAQRPRPLPALLTPPHSAVGNLPWHVTDDVVRKLFDQFPGLLEIKIIADRESGRSKGFGFITFADPEVALRAITVMHGTTFHNRLIKVNIARSLGPLDGGGGDGGGSGSGGDSGGSGGGAFMPHRSRHAYFGPMPAAHLYHQQQMQVQLNFQFQLQQQQSAQLQVLQQQQAQQQAQLQAQAQTQAQKATPMSPQRQQLAQQLAQAQLSPSQQQRLLPQAPYAIGAPQLQPPYWPFGQPSAFGVEVPEHLPAQHLQAQQLQAQQAQHLSQQHAVHLQAQHAHQLRWQAQEHVKAQALAAMAAAQARQQLEQ